MHYIDLMINTISSLRNKGLYKEASCVKDFLCKYAQNVANMSDNPADAAADLESDLGIEPEEESLPIGAQEKVQVQSDELPKMQRTLYYQFEKWHNVIDRELGEFDYFSADFIDAILAAFANVHKVFEQAMANVSTDFDKSMVDSWNSEIARITQKMHQSQNSEINETKAKVDSFLLYDTTDLLYKKFNRLCAQDGNFAAVKAEFDSLMHAFTNVIQNISEEIAKVDLTKTR